MFSKIKQNWKVWFHTVSLLLLALIEFLKIHLPDLQAIMTPETYKYAGVCVVILNAWLHREKDASTDTKDPSS